MAGQPPLAGDGGSPPPSPNQVGIFLGQSIVGDSDGLIQYNVRHPNNLNLDIHDGTVHQAREPLLGPFVGGFPDGTLDSFVGQLGDLLCDIGKCIVIADFAHGGTYARDWAPGGAYSGQIPIIASQIHALGLTPAFIYWGQGINEAGDCSATATQWMDSVRAVRQEFTANGINVPMVISKQTNALGGVRPCSSQIRAAQIAIVDGVNFFAGEDFDSIGNDYKNPDPSGSPYTHLTTAGDALEAWMVRPTVAPFIH
jgi:hypothetical protein